MRGIESSVVYPAWISFGRVDKKACSPFLSSVNSSSRVSSHFSGRRWMLFNSWSRARRGYIAWAQPIFLLSGFLSSVQYMRFGSVTCDSQTRVGEERWIASRRVVYPVVVSWPSVFIMNVSHFRFALWLIFLLPSSRRLYPISVCFWDVCGLGVGCLSWPLPDWH